MVFSYSQETELHMQLQVLSFDVIDVCSYMSIMLMSECKCRKTGNVPQQDTHHLTEIIIAGCPI